MFSYNYRSPGNIVEISSNFMKRNLKRFDKNHNTDNDYAKTPEIVETADEISQPGFLIEA